eukprot:12552578-Alexandrium_andersonii.AAC.1
MHAITSGRWHWSICARSSTRLHACHLSVRGIQQQLSISARQALLPACMPSQLAPTHSGVIECCRVEPR